MARGDRKSTRWKKDRQRKKKARLKRKSTEKGKARKT
jgi:hypothetical protein